MNNNSYLIKNAKPIGFNYNENNYPNLFIGVNSEGIIDFIGNNKPEKNYKRIIDLKNNFLSPGWVDLHTHIYKISDIAVNPCQIGPKTGVLLTVDAGTAGEASFSGFKEYVLEKYNFPIKSYLNLSSTGIVATNKVSELFSLDYIDLDNTIKCIEKNKNIIKGIKIRASRAIIGDIGIKTLKMAKKVSKIVNLPVIVHVGEPPLFIEDVVDILKQGDMITHCFNGKRGINLINDPEIVDILKKASQKGILIDTGHGGASYSHKVAEKAISLDIYPDTISTDLHQGNINGPVWDLATTISKIKFLGFNLSQIIKKVTKNPANFLGIDNWIDLKIGDKACFTAFSVKKGKYTVEDANAFTEVTTASSQERLTFALNEFICPQYSFYTNNIYKVDINYNLEK